MDELETTEAENGDIHVVVEPRGVTEQLAFCICFTIATAAFMAGFFCHAEFKKQSANCVLQDSTVKAQAQAQSKQIDMQLANEKYIESLRIKVVENCVAEKKTPIFENNNIQCR